MWVVVIDLAAAIVCALCIAEHLVDVKNELGQFVPWMDFGLNLRLSPSTLHTHKTNVLNYHTKMY